MSTRRIPRKVAAIESTYKTLYQNGSVDILFTEFCRECNVITMKTFYNGHVRCFVCDVYEPCYDIASLFNEDEGDF
jgi:hypothetical protein